MTNEPQPTRDPWLFDSIGCDQEWDIEIGAEKYCIHHAEEKADMEQANRLHAKN